MGKWEVKLIHRKKMTDLDFTPEQMRDIAQLSRNSVFNRIRSAVDVNDNPAPPLKSQRYAAWKVGKFGRFGATDKRDWFRTGHTMRALQVLRATVNEAVVGFTDATSNLRARMNQRLWRQFGVSPKDKEVIVRAITDQLQAKSKSKVA